jgi:hypothetical protein
MPPESLSFVERKYFVQVEKFEFLCKNYFFFEFLKMDKKFSLKADKEGTTHPKINIFFRWRKI